MLVLLTGMLNELNEFTKQFMLTYTSRLCFRLRFTQFDAAWNTIKSRTSKYLSNRTNIYTIFFAWIKAPALPTSTFRLEFRTYVSTGVQNRILMMDPIS